MQSVEMSGGTQIVVEVPAKTENMAIVRTVAAAVAARADLTLDQIEDMRLAIDEAIAHLIAHASDGASIRCAMAAEGAAFEAFLRCPTAHTAPPQPEPFSWTVLTALVGSVDIAIKDGDLAMRWRVTRDHSVTA